MASRNERRKRAKQAFILRESRRLIREEKRAIGIQRDKVMAQVRENLSHAESLCPPEERAWLGKGCSSVYSPVGAVSAQRYGTGKTLSVVKGPVKQGRLRGRATDVTY